VVVNKLKDLCEDLWVDSFDGGRHGRMSVRPSGARSRDKSTERYSRRLSSENLFPNLETPSKRLNSTQVDITGDGNVGEWTCKGDKAVLSSGSVTENDQQVGNCRSATKGEEIWIS